MLGLRKMEIRKWIEIANANPEEKPKVERGWRRLNVLWE